MRLLIAMLLAAAVLQCALRTALACGMTTHTEIAHRAEVKRARERAVTFLTRARQGWFDDAQISTLLRENYDAFEAGAPFPDWGYSCTFDGHHFSDESEAAHWGLFLNNFTRHLLESYGPPQKWPQSARARSVAAFLFGLRSHQVAHARDNCKSARVIFAQVADVLWHWGPDGAGDLQGFLRSESHFSSTCMDQWNAGPAPTCHTIGDVGADLVLGSLKLGGNIRTWSWAVPVDDIVAVYRRMGSAFDLVTPEAINHCVKLLYAGRAAVWDVGDAAVPHFSAHAAFMEQELNDFVYGGLEDMAIQTADAWTELAQVFRGEKPMPPPFNPPESAGTVNIPQGPAPTSLASSWWVESTAESTKSIVHPASNISHFDRTSVLPPIIAEALIDSKQIFLEMMEVIKREQGFVHVEKALSLVWGSGTTFREQMGLSISSGKDIVAAISTRSLLVWDVQGNFLYQIPVGGRSIVVAEVTGDKYEDVLISTRNGSVYLVDGQTQRANVVMESTDRAFATRIDVSDCNGDGRSDVLLSSPQMSGGGYQRGSASVYLASSAGIDWLKPSWYAEGVQNSQWFGRGLACASGYVAVGSPGWRAGGNSSSEGVGMVQLFQLEMTVPLHSIEGHASQQQFGFSVAISGSLLLVGSPGHSANISTFAGKLEAFNFPEVTQPAIWLLEGDQPFARFGMSIAVAPVCSSCASVVAVGQPHRKTAVDGGNHGGAVTFLVGLGNTSHSYHNKPSEVKYDCKSSACFLGGSMRFLNASYILLGVPLVSEYGSILGLKLSL